jgi:hypothetical protein
MSSEEAAAIMARNCNHFSEDDEEEQMAEEPLHCYNCRYRRWTADGFTCEKK